MPGRAPIGALRGSQRRTIGTGRRAAYRRPRGWLDTPPERAVIETRYEEAQEDKAAEQTNQAVNQVMQALQDHGYEPKLPRAEDLEIEGDGQLPVWKPR